MEEVEYNKQMKQVVLSIEAEIGQKLADNIEPELIIITPRTLDRLLDYMMNPDEVDNINWREPLYLSFADGQVTLRVIRTQDLENGQVIIK